MIFLLKKRLVMGYDLIKEFRVVLINKVLNNADSIIAASTKTYETCREIVEDPSKVHLIPNGVDVNRFNTFLDGSRIRKKLGLKDQAIVFTLRKHDSKYGIEFLIRAAAIVKRIHPKIVFIIGGDGPLKNYHEKLAMLLGVSDIVIFTGEIPQEEMPFYYAMSDIAVTPSVQEAFGLVITEAMACGKPVIGTRVGGIPDQIIDGYNGFLVTPKNPLEIAQKICWMIENPDKANQMGLNGRKTVEEKFNFNKRTKDIFSLYKSLI